MLDQTSEFCNIATPDNENAPICVLIPTEYTKYNTQYFYSYDYV